jgi:hypothetical protein
VSEMNLIMENWRGFQESKVEVLSENEIATLVNDALEQALKAAEEELEKKSSQETENPALGGEEKALEETQQLDESIVIAGVLVGLWVKTVGILATGAVIARVGNWIGKKTGMTPQTVHTTPDGRQQISTPMLEKFADVLGDAARQLGTGGFHKIAGGLVNQFVNDPTKKNAYLKQIDMMANLLVFIITVGSSVTELHSGALAATESGVIGSISEYFAKLATDAGVSDVPGMSAMADLFESGVDAGEFIKGSAKVIAKALRARGRP